MPEWKLGDPTATDRHMQYGAGGALNEDTGLWQLWVSLDGYRINWVAAYQEQARIDEAMQALKAIGGTGDLFDVEKLRATFDRLHAESEAEPVEMPEANKEIRRNLRGTGTWK